MQIQALPKGKFFENYMRLGAHEKFIQTTIFDIPLKRSFFGLSPLESMQHESSHRKLHGENGIM